MKIVKMKGEKPILVIYAEDRNNIFSRDCSIKPLFQATMFAKKLPPSGPKSYMSLEIGSSSYFFSFKPLIKDNQIDKTFIKQPLSKLFGFQFRKDWDGIFVKKSFACYIFSRIVITLTNHGLVDALANT